jgi:hypothetical protein
MAEYYHDQEIEDMAERDNEIDRLGRLEQIRDLDKRTKELIQEQSKIIIEAAIAARDKWWVERLILAERKCRDLKCGYYRECGCIDSFGGNLCIWWQQLKLSLQSSEALTNLMGKFPDLPDTTEED